MMLDQSVLQWEVENDISGGLARKPVPGGAAQLLITTINCEFCFVYLFGCVLVLQH